MVTEEEIIAVANSRIWPRGFINIPRNQPPNSSEQGQIAWRENERQKIIASIRNELQIAQATEMEQPVITQPIDGQPILIPIVPPVLEQTKVFGLTLKQIAVLIGIGVLVL